LCYNIPKEITLEVGVVTNYFTNAMTLRPLYNTMSKLPFVYFKNLSLSNTHNYFFSKHPRDDGCHIMLAKM
jgi:hypothetical protein